MIKYFTINDLSRYLVLLVIFIITRAFYLWFFNDPFLIELHFKGVATQLNELGYSYVDVHHNFGPFSAGTFRWFYGFFDSFLPARLFAGLLGFSQVLILTIGLNRVEAFHEKNLFVGVIYIILLHLFPDMIVLSPLLLSMTLLTLIFVFVLNIVSGKAKEEIFLYAGLLTAISGCFLFPIFLFSIPTLLIIIIYTRFDSRFISLYIFGLFLPIVLLLAFYQFYDSAERYLKLNFYYGFSVRFISQLPIQNYIAVAIVPAIFFVVGFLKILSSRNLINSQQKMIVASIFYLVSCVVILVLLPEKSVYYYLLFLPFLLHFLGVLFMEYNKQKFAIIMSLSFFALIITGSFFNYIPFVKSVVDYKPLYAKKIINNYGKVLNLSDDKNILYNNNYATGFCEYMIAKKYFLDHSIESTAFVYSELIADLPDAIFDPNKIVGEKFDKIPMLKEKYNYFESQNIYLLRK